MSADDYSRPRELFLGFEGSRSYIWRDGFGEEYESYGVPPDVEQAWFDELLQERLSGLREPGNWRSVSFLKLHRRSELLKQVAAAGPAGEWWERCAFLEETLRFVEYTCRRFYPPEHLAEVCRSIIVAAAPLAGTMPADQPPDRIERLVAHARSLENRLLARA